MTNKLAGKDPAGGTVKVLDLKYKLNGKTYPKKFGKTELFLSGNKHYFRL